MDTPQQFIKILAGIYALAIVIELIWAKKQPRQVYNWKDSLANIAIVVGGKLIQPLSLAWGYYVFTQVMPYQLFIIESNTLMFILAFLLVEFIFYWHHRFNHEVPFLWTIHHTHHSSPWFNFITAGRLNWMGKFLGPLFYIPVILLGFSPETVTLMLALSLVYQIFVHTEMIGKLGWIEGILNTPSAHRVHHGSNEAYLDKNYGGILMVFDRLFGTYQAEEEKVKFGVTTGFIGHNPFIINFLPMIQLFRKKAKTKTENKTNTFLEHTLNQ